MVNVYLVSKVIHCSQIITGLKLLEETGRIKLSIKDCINDRQLAENNAIVLLDYNDKKMVFDLQDGYWNGMEYYIQKCDYYFKRSYSEKKNRIFTIDQRKKIKPLGFNYFVSCQDNPYNYNSYYKSLARLLLGKTKPSVFTTEFYECKPPNRNRIRSRIIFITRLYDQTNIENNTRRREIHYINSMRIDLLRRLRASFDNDFIGGLEDNRVARFLAPELILPRNITKKKNYIKLLHSCDIGIGSMGLFESIGWKTAEYIAASMGIVNETFHYHVPGNFEKGKNYLEFSTPDECIEKVYYLKSKTDLLHQMRVKNWNYYENYLAPEKLVWNALKQCQ